MKYEKLIIGEAYKTKLSGSWQLVHLVSKREEFNAGKLARDRDVLVKTGAGNIIYRTPGQLRKAD